MGVGNKMLNKVINLIKLMRVHHYLKNVLILVPLVFSSKFFEGDTLGITIIGFISFSLLASSIYINNDIQDVESDKKHEVKCKRPIASGIVSVKEANTLMAILLVSAIVITGFFTKNPIVSITIIIIYFILNVLYSAGLKHKPIIDIAILVSGFLLRVLYGAVIINVKVSNWLYLTVIAMSFFLGLGKRRNELAKKGSETRKVLEHYTPSFLDKNMYMSLAMTIVFYALWCVDPLTTERFSSELLIWTVPVVMLICMKYSLIIEGDSFGDPVDVILHDKVLIFLILGYGIMTFLIIYGNNITKLFL